jgi:endonuclease G
MYLYKKNMRNLFIIFLFLIFSSFQGDDIIKVSHTNYTSTFSVSNRYPVVVEWWLTKEMISCDDGVERSSSFKTDPKISKLTNLSKYYKNSGYDRGHMMPSADNLCQTKKIQEESFYFSNISPQYKELNRGDWKSLEIESRKYSMEHDSVYIWTGNIGQIKKIGKVSVPKYCWKVIYIKKLNIKKGFLFENNESKSDGFENNEVDVQVIEKLTGINFNTN